MFLRELSRKITESYKTPLSEAEAEDHIRLLAEVAPDWCRLSSVDNGTLLKIERHKALREVKNGILNALAKM
ncbi:hypothetical protein BC936DRAFT_141233 [Jimgerdemannia flammicorona]|nr:hypothetical protein BC936DRAFT_141233 [Jimgerdemannia flammicorona]